MYCKVLSATMLGLSCRMITVEADIGDGLPLFDMVGVLACEVKEAKERVRTAMRNCSMPLPPKRITVSLSPADVRKEGSAFDLPIACAILSAMGRIPEKALAKTLIVGELGLNGAVRPVRGILPIVAKAKQDGIRRCVLPKENEKEGSLIRGMTCIGVDTLTETAMVLSGEKDAVKTEPEPDRLFIKEPEYTEDFSQLSGQQAVKRGAEIAAAGFHNLLMIGPPGAGKTMIARRLPSILPSLSFEESLEISKVYSVAGLLQPDSPLLSRRPFRAPHHTVTAAALIGGGARPKPGEISLASRGVLFLDELTEFHKRTLDLLRQPMEDHKVVLARASGSYVYPADFMLVAAMNPCRCGYFPDMEKCTCTSGDIKGYLGRISKPLLDRMDLCLETSRVSYSQLAKEKDGEPSSVIRKRVEAAMKRQQKRYCGTGFRFNGELSPDGVRQFCRPDREGEKLLERAFEALQMSARTYHRILKVARTIADLEGEERIAGSHIAEAIGYRSVDRKYWA